TEVFDRPMLVAQVDQLIMSAVAALDGPDEALMVARLQGFRRSVAGEEPVFGSDGEDMSVARAAALTEVDDYFRRVLRAVPSIAAYLDELAARPA
ncbi:MAG: hypothetical protein LH650_15185, partial [Chloroflexi bacterium]|nr:hypothetical protein [Chloroflexota bacterium]